MVLSCKFNVDGLIICTTAANCNDIACDVCGTPDVQIQPSLQPSLIWTAMALLCELFVAIIVATAAACTVAVEYDDE